MVPWLRPGGADKCNIDLISQLRQRGWEVTVVASLASPQEWEPRFTALTSDVFVLPNFLNPAHGPDFVSYLIASRNPDVVLLSHSEFAYMLLPFLRREFPALPVLDLNHIEEMGWRNGGYPRMSVGTGHLLDRQLVISDHLGNWMVGEGADPSRIDVCYLNVDERLWRPDATVRAASRAKYDIGHDTPLIVFAGRICPQKQPHILAKVLNALAARGLEFIALVAGDGEDMPSLRRAVSRGAAARRVRLLGMTANDEVRRLMQAADVFFLPSEWEGIALGIYEAMSCGLAIVGADVGGQRELVTKECGILLARGSVIEETARYTEALASLVADPARMRSMGLASRERIERHFRLDQMGDCFAKVLTDAVDRGPAGAKPEDREASEARERSVQFLASQWQYARRRSRGNATMRILKAVPLPAGYRGAIAGAYRVWRSEGAKGVAQRVRDRLGAKWRKAPGPRSR
jgi:glycosyltransferase involved in cell wall biosynthesis